MKINLNIIEKLFYIVISLIILLETNSRYYYMHSHVADLGLFLNGILNTPLEWQRAFWGHSQAIQIIFGQLSLIINAEYLPYFLINIQSLTLIGTVIYIRSNFGKLTGFALLLYCPLWTLLSFGFHFDFFAVPLLAIFLTSIRDNKYKTAYVSAALLIFIKEIFCLQVIFCGLYILFIKMINRQKKMILVFALLITGIFSFYINMHFILPNINSNYIGLKSAAFNSLGGEIFGIIIYTSRNITEIIFEILTNKEKITFLIYAFGQLLFIPFLSPSFLIMTIPIFAASLLSQISNYYSYNTHYLAGAIIPIIAAYHYGLIRLKNFIVWNKFFKLIIYFSIIAGLFTFTTFPLSRLFISTKYTELNYKNYMDDGRSEEIKSLLAKFIPTDNNIFISSQNSFNYYPLYTKVNYLPFPSGVTNKEILTTFTNGKKEIREKNADFVIIDLKRPIYIYDKGCNFQYGKCQDQKIESEFFRIYEGELKEKYMKIASFEGFEIYKKKSE